MKKPITLFFSCLLLFNFSFAQVFIQWQRNLGGSSNDIAYAIKQTSDGGYISVGVTLSNDFDVSGNHGGQDFWVVKLDSSGNLEWQKCLGGSSHETANSIQQTTDGGYIVAGNTNSNDGNVSGNHGNIDYWVVKLDSSGNIQWQKCLGGTDWDDCYSIQQTSDGGYFVAGYSSSNNGDISGNHGGADYWVVKLDSAGNIQWQKCLGGSSGEFGTSAQQTSDGGYVIAGSSSSNDGNVTGMHGVSDYWVVKLDNGGNLQWQKCLGGSDYEVAYSVQQTNDNGYVLNGWTDSNDGDVSGLHNIADHWVVKLDSSGNLQWQKCLGGSGVEYGRCVKQTPDGGYIVSGDTDSNDGDVSGNHSFGSVDYWIVKLDSNGNFEWQKCLGGTGIDEGEDIELTSDGSYIVTGRAQSDNGNATGNYGGFDFWIVKFTDHYNSIDGKMFFDFNSNNMQDANEPALINKKITESNTGRFSFSNTLGQYEVVVFDTGNFSVSPSSLVNYYTPSPFAHTAYFGSIYQIDSINDFAFQPTVVLNDLCVAITPTGNFRAGMNASYMINYENVGTTTLSPTVIFFPDNDVTFVSANPVASFVTTDSMVWNFGPLTPFQTGSILVTVNVNTGTPIGTLINSGVRIEPVAGDANTACNYSYWEVLSTGSIDPNEILVDRDTVLTTELSNPPYLEYIIYFQNTGNDTAFNAKILNPVDTFKLDLSSFEFVASSHPVNIEYKIWERNLYFTFDNINLPDSIVNEPASHGFVRYRIKPKTTLTAGAKIYNQAYIYFDFNQPVQTNTAVTEIVLPTGLGEVAGGSGRRQVLVYPNPAWEVITLKMEQGARGEGQVTIYDLFGREVFQSEIRNSQSEIKIDVSGFSNGVYFLEINSGEIAYRAKFVKQ